MTSQTQILDLDKSLSIKELGIYVNPKFMGDLIYTLMVTIKKNGKYLGITYYESMQISQYVIQIKYLNNIMNVIFEFDHSVQFMNIVYYNDDQSKTYLKIFLSIDDEPTIKYLENDKSGFVMGYQDNNVLLKPGEYLVNFAHCLMSYIGFYRLRLDDDSYLITKNKNGEEIRTKLWMYYLIKNKKSWYAKFGYVPGNCTINEYNLLIEDVSSIKLGEISLKLKQILSARNKHFIDPLIIETAELLVDVIGNSNETLYEYTINHSLENFTLLTNNLFQSFFSRNLNLVIVDNNNIQTNNNIKSSYITIDFQWFNTIKKLLVINVMQINNNIANCYYKLK